MSAITPSPLTPPAPSAPQAGDERLAPISRVTRVMRRPELGSLMGAAVVWALFAITDASPNHLWLNQAGLAEWTQQPAFFGILVVPVGLLMIGGEFDLSTGVMTAATAIVMALLVGKYQWDTWPAIVGTLVFASVIGLINGIFVVRTKLPSFIVTLATFFVLRGVSVGGVLLLNHGSTQVTVTTANPAGLSSAKSVFGSSFFSSGALPSGYSTAIIWFVIVTIIGSWVLSRTTFGNWIFAAGGEENAARNVGVPVDRTKVLLFLSTALAAAVVGIISFTQSSSAVSEQGGRLRVLLHHRPGGRWLPVDRRLRLGDRGRPGSPGRLHHRDGVRGRHLLRLGQLVGLRVSRRDPVSGRRRQHDHLPACAEGPALTRGAFR